MGDASNYHYTLACALRRLGHDVTVASAGSGWMDTMRDIDISRRVGKVGGGILWLKLNTILAKKFKGYDIVHISTPVFLDLKPKRIKAIFDKLVSDNDRVFISMLGTDSQYVDMCLSNDSSLKYNEFLVDGMPTPYTISHKKTIEEWLGNELYDLCSHVYGKVSGAVTALYEYHLAGMRHFDSKRLAYGGIPIDTSAIPFSKISTSGPLRILVASHKGREREKGIDLILPEVRRVAKNNPSQVVLDMVQNVPFNEFRTRLQAADIVVDQLYSYTPATSALMAMAAGKIVISGAESEYYNFISEEVLHPIINANPLSLDSLYYDIEGVIKDEELRRFLSEKSRQFVEKHNDMMVVAKRFVDFWQI